MCEYLSVASAYFPFSLLHAVCYGAVSRTFPTSLRIGVCLPKSTLYECADTGYSKEHETSSGWASRRCLIAVRPYEHSRLCVNRQTRKTENPCTTFNLSSENF